MKALHKAQVSMLFIIASLTNHFIAGNLTTYCVSKFGLALTWCL